MKEKDMEDEAGGWIRRKIQEGEAGEGRQVGIAPNSCFIILQYPPAFPSS
jgi:hypothetical protein